MKKHVYLFLAIFSLYTVSILSAQENINPEWKQSGDIQFGIAIGLNNAALTLAEDDTNPNPNDYQSAYTIGARIDYFFNKNWSIKLMPSYDVRKLDNFFWEEEYKYLTIPVLANWHFGKNRRWNLHFGPHYSAALDSGTLTSSMGADIGIGIIIPISSLRFFIELDGVSDFDNGQLFVDDPSGNPVGTPDLRWFRSSINVGVVF